MKEIIKKPIISEKATGASEKFNRFTFEVDRKANKLEIKKAVEKKIDELADLFKKM